MSVCGCVRGERLNKVAGHARGGNAASAVLPLPRGPFLDS